MCLGLLNADISRSEYKHKAHNYGGESCEELRGTKQSKLRRSKAITVSREAPACAVSTADRSVNSQGFTAKPSILPSLKEPDKFASIPEQDVPTPLSKRWQRCAWQQACGIVQSWYSNECKNPPVLRNVCIQASANVVVIEPSRTPTFDYWLRISTLEVGKPVRIPIQLYDRAKETLASFPKLCTSVTLNERKGEWYATFVVERKTKKPNPKEVVGVDIGMVSIVSTSEGHHYGQISEELRKRVENSFQKRRRKQKLNACLKRKGRPEVSLSDSRAEAYAKNEIGHALNFMISEIPNPNDASVAIERLSVKDMRFKSRQMIASFLATLCVLHSWATCVTSSNSSWTNEAFVIALFSLLIPANNVLSVSTPTTKRLMGFTFKMNRRNQSEFSCLFCGYSANADFNAARNIAERFGDDEINRLSFRELETVLAIRFLRRHPVARSATAGIELHVVPISSG